MQCELNQSYSTIDNSIISESNHCVNSFENKTSEEIINILNLFIEKSKELPNYSQKLKKQEKSIFNAKKIPKISLKEYLERIKFYTEIENNTLIISLIYIDRLLQNTNLILTPYNIHRTLFTSIILALKYNEDINYDFSYYSKVAGISIKELKKLESEFFYLIDFSLYVQTEQFDKYKEYLLNSGDEN